MDLLKYSETVLHICFAEKSRREIHDIFRQVYLVPHQIRICPCVKDPWVRKTLEFLNAVYDNEPSHKSDRHEPNREFPSGTTKRVDSADQYGV